MCEGYLGNTQYHSDLIEAARRAIDLLVDASPQVAHESFSELRRELTACQGEVAALRRELKASQQAVASRDSTVRAFGVSHKKMANDLYAERARSHELTELVKELRRRLGDDD